MSQLLLRNRQTTRAVDLRLLRQISEFVLSSLEAESPYEIGIHLIGAEEMAGVNETFLQHSGSTDVITFDYSNESEANAPAILAERHASARSSNGALNGEMFISVDDAVHQARQFRTTWQSELARYVIHGILHLKGYDDLSREARRKMKTQENRLLRQVGRRFPLTRLHRRSPTLE
jgi:probable rRNA maturation factor